MQCPYCNSLDTSVTETRVTTDGLRRRRTCGACKRRFTTYERVGAPSVKVGKRDGAFEAFDRDKLLRALERIAAHRPAVSPEDLRRIARDIEATVVESGKKTVAWNELVELALARLRNVDPVSAQRLAANYTDESGAVRLEVGHDVPGAPSPQLGLDLPTIEEDS